MSNAQVQTLHITVKPMTVVTTTALVIATSAGIKVMCAELNPRITKLVRRIEKQTNN